LVHNLPKAEALRKAQRGLLDPDGRGLELEADASLPVPRAWAGFVLSGAWR